MFIEKQLVIKEDQNLSVFENAIFEVYPEIIVTNRKNQKKYIKKKNK